MAWKKPEIYLTNGRRHFCRICRCDMSLQMSEFEMKRIGGKYSIIVKDNVLICPNCKNLFVTQEMCRQLVKNNPGYYLDASTYDLKLSKKKRNQNDEVYKKNSNKGGGNEHTSLKNEEVRNNELAEVAKRIEAHAVSARLFLYSSVKEKNTIIEATKGRLRKSMLRLFADNNL